MTIRKPTLSHQSAKTPSTRCTATTISPVKPLLAIPTADGDSYAAHSPGGGEIPTVEEDIWAEERSSNEQGNYELPSRPRSGKSEQSFSETRVGNSQPLLQTSQGVITPRTSSESQNSRTLENVFTIATPLPTVGHPVPEARYRSSPKNPFRQMNDNRQLPDQSHAEAHSSTKIWNDSLTGDIDNKVDSTLVFQCHPSAEPGAQATSASNHPQPAAHNTSVNRSIADVNSVTGKAYSNGLIELQEGLQGTGDDYAEPQEGPQEEGGNGAADIFDLDVSAGDSDRSKQAQPTPNPTDLSILWQPQHSLVPNPPQSNTREPHDNVARLPPQLAVRTDAASTKESIDSTQNSNPSTDVSSKPRRASETYQIRLVNWYDASSHTNPRRSPIMVQNANGPCPLLALVNALVLSTPSNITTALVETLRVREQVSLGLLLDAVIDELMSGRRGDVAQTLPDVSELYAFLLTLHTGMNINPCFVVSDDKAPNLTDALIHGQTNPEYSRKPGDFENTREMKLYSAFGVPLIHGWIAPTTHPAFRSLKRRARTYEDAQNIMFKEDELEEKLKSNGLTPEEQVMLEDIGSVKYFLSSTATQLTDYGLGTITEALARGTIAILFRNDHFNTLYRHPRSGQLLTLVTDMGYAGHDEVVWESLVDVSGEGSRFFAGDFRPVEHVAIDSQQPNGHAAQVDEEGWETVRKKTRKSDRTNQSGSDTPLQPSSDLLPMKTLNLGAKGLGLSPNSEQEDHDLALAMQLQEEEEERERREVIARRRENELSQAYLNSSDAQGRRTFPGFGRGAQGRPNVPPRGGSGTNRNNGPTASARQAPRGQRPSEDVPPPSYEQAAQGPAYHPPVNHPAHPHAASLGPSGNTARPPAGRTRQGSSAYSEQTAAFNGASSTQTASRRKSGKGRNSAGVGQLEGAPGMVRRRSDMAGVQEDRKEKDCVVM
ncbi:MAG: hypothetical protein Q9217_002630 [Psora testacea]